jgi:hypothetical protein
MHRTLLVLGTLTFVACAGDTDTDPVDTDTVAPGDCTTSVEWTYPEDGATDAFYQTTAQFKLNREDLTASITLADSTGADVPGTTSHLESRVIFTPDAALMTEASYTASLTFECGSDAATFTTAAGATAISDDLTGNTYTLDLAAGNFLQPEGLQSLLGTLLEFDILIGVTAPPGDTLPIMGAVGDGEGGQSPCTPSIEFSEDAEFSQNPYFVATNDSLPITVDGEEINILDFRLTGAFTPDGTAIEGGTLTGLVDTSPLADALGEGEGLCDLLPQLGTNCQACPETGEPLCLFVDIVDLVLPVADGLTLYELTQAEVDEIPECDVVEE